jgi:hypothetical protein
VTRYQSTHVQGGTIMAPTPDRGVANPYLQQWQFPSVFVLGAPTFPKTGSANPTPTILALTYRTADDLMDRYMKRPAPLVYIAHRHSFCEKRPLVPLTQLYEGGPDLLNTCRRERVSVEQIFCWPLRECFCESFGLPV